MNMQSCRMVSATFAALCLVLSSCASSPTVKIRDLALGDGETAGKHSRVTIHYSGWLMDGTMFDTTRTDGTPQTFTVNGGDVIVGLDQAVIGMKAGGRREIFIPPVLAYGARGLNGHIPPNATLRFDVEVLTVMPPRYKNISVDELAKRKRDLVLIDIRTPKEWIETGVIEGSVLLTAFDESKSVARDFLHKIDRIGEVDLAIICRSGNRSSELARILSERGHHKNFYNVVGGVVAWERSGRQLEKKF